MNKDPIKGKLWPVSDQEKAEKAQREEEIVRRQRRMETPEGLAEVLQGYLENDERFAIEPGSGPGNYFTSNEWSFLTKSEPLLCHRKCALNAALAVYRKYPGIPDPPNESDNPVADIRAVATWAVKVAAACKPKPPAADTQDGEASEQIIEGERSDPMTKKGMMTIVDISSYQTFNAWAKTHGIKQAGNRQLFTVRLDMMDARTRAKFEKKK